MPRHFAPRTLEMSAMPMPLLDFCTVGRISIEKNMKATIARLGL